VANNRKATPRRCARQEKAREPPAQPALDAELRELVRNLNWFLVRLRAALESEEGRALAGRFRQLAAASCIIEGLALDAEGWAALLRLKNARSFAKLKRRRHIPAHKPGQTLLYSAADVLRASARGFAEAKDEDESP
jgi:hypothetical protein